MRRGDEVVVAADAPAAVRPLLDLYAPVCFAQPERGLTIAHLGQSLDGFIATASGDSYYVTGPDNVRHLHRLRALSAAIVVGAGTVARDDPQLTVRHVEGRNPVRVVLDPRRSARRARRVFTDGAAPTLVVHAEGIDAPAPGDAEILHVPMDGNELKLDVLARSGCTCVGLRTCSSKAEGRRCRAFSKRACSIACTSRSRRS